MPVSQQLAAVQKAYPEAQVTQFIPAHQPDLANRFSVLFSDGSTQFVTVSPYSAVVLGAIDRSESWYEWANSIHGTLLIGDWGDYLIEVAASLGMILLVSGIYLWLPLDNARKAGFLKIRVGSGARIFWRDLHANLGGMLSLVLLFFLISGLSWAGIWGGNWCRHGIPSRRITLGRKTAIGTHACGFKPWLRKRDALELRANASTAIASSWG